MLPRAGPEAIETIKTEMFPQKNLYEPDFQEYRFSKSGVIFYKGKLKNALKIFFTPCFKQKFFIGYYLQLSQRCAQ